jgi:hypothetical protein
MVTSMPPRQRTLALTLAVIGIAGAVLGIAGWRRSAKELDEIEAQTRALAEQAVSFTIAGIEHAMLQGKGVMIKQLVERFRHRVPDADVHIYDNLGFEVFNEPPPAPAKSGLAPDLLKVLDGGPRMVTKDNRVLRPLADEERCRPCHDEKPLRGVLAMTPHPDVLAKKRHDILPAVIRNAFVAVMTSEHAYMLDDFFNHLIATAPNLRAVGIYGNDGLLRFGKEVSGLALDEIKPSLLPGAAPRLVKREGHTISLVQLPKEVRCQACHKKDPNPVRGVLAVAMTDSEEPAQTKIEELESIVDSSIRVIMVSSLGRMILKFLRGVGETGAMSDIVVYDNVGRTYFSGAPATPPPIVKTLLANPSEKTIEDAHPGDGHVLIARSLANEGKCITCHGTESKIRGIVTMTLAPTSNDQPRSQAIRTATLFTAIGVAGAFLVVIALVLLRRRQLGGPA